MIRALKIRDLTQDERLICLILEMRILDLKLRLKYRKVMSHEIEDRRDRVNQAPGTNA